MTTILAYDPGITTGYCKAHIEGDTWVLDEAGEFSESDIIYDQLSWLAGVQQLNRVIVVYEDFLLKTMGQPQKDTIKVIGVLEGFARQLGVPKHSQYPADKIFVKRRLKAIYDRLDSHWGDAVMHSLFYAFTQHGIRSFYSDKLCAGFVLDLRQKENSNVIPT